MDIEGPGDLPRDRLFIWNGKVNGDNLLNKIAELLTEQVKDVKIIKMWEVDPELHLQNRIQAAVYTVREGLVDDSPQTQ